MKVGTPYTADELLKKAVRYKGYWGKERRNHRLRRRTDAADRFSDRTFPESQSPGIHTTLDTSGNPFTREGERFEKIKKLLEVTDLVMLDIKHIDDEQHKILTGQTNQNILDMARYLDEIGKPMWIRHVLVPERSDKDEYLTRLDAFIQSLHNVQKVEVLPYHTLVHTNGKNSVMSIRWKASIRRLRRESKMQISCCIQERGFKVFTGHIIIGNVMKKAKHFS